MNYYQLLGLPRQATRDQIRAAYLRLAGELHPDRHVGNGEKERAEREKFKIIQEAYEVLRDPDRRRDYDLKHGAIPQRRTQPAPGARAAAARGPVRSSPTMRRDVPDDWVRGSGRSARFRPWFRALATIGIVLFVVTAVVPRIGQILESQLSDIFGSTEDFSPHDSERPRPHLNSEQFANQELAQSAIVQEDALPGEQEIHVGQPDAAPIEPPIQDMADYLMQENAKLHEDDPQIAFDSHLIASQDGPDHLNDMPARTEWPPQLSHETFGVSAEVTHYDHSTSTEGLPGYRPRQSGKHAKVPRSNTRYAPRPGSELSAPNPSLAPDTINTGLPRYDSHFTNARGGLPDPYAKPGMSAYGGLPGTSSHADQLLRTERYGLGSFESSISPNYGNGMGGTSNYGTAADPLPNYTIPRTPSSGKSRSRTSALYPQ